MNYDTTACGARIRQLRVKNSLTQENIANALNIDRSFYSRVEAGKKVASVDLFIQLSALFNTTLDYLVLGRHTAFQSDSPDVIQLKEDIENLSAHLDYFKHGLC